MSTMFHNRVFRLFFLADIISSFGVGLGAVGVNWYVLAETGSNRDVGFLLTLNVFVGLLITPFSGFIIDRFKRRHVLIVTFLFRVMLLSVVALLFWSYGFQLWIIYLYIITNGIGWTIYLSASRSFIQEIIPRENLAKGNSFVEISMQVGMFAAGAASGMLYKFWGFEVILLVNILMFILSGLLLFSIKEPNSALISVSNPQPFFASFKTGLIYLRKRPKLFGLGILTVVPLVVTMLYNVVLPAYVTDAIKGDSIVFGLADMFYGVGGLISGLAIVMISQRVKSQYLIFSLFLIAVLNLFWLGINAQILILYLGSCVLGITNSGLRIVMNTLLMEKVDSAYMGRSMAVWTGFSLLIQMLGSSSIGVLIDYVGAQTGFIVMAGIMLVGVLVLSKLNIKSIEGGIEHDYS